MENKETKTTMPYSKRLTDLENKVKDHISNESFNDTNDKPFTQNEWDFLLGAFIISNLFGSWADDNKIKEIEKRLEKLEIKNEMLEKIVLK